MLPYYDDRLSTVIAGPVPERALARVQYRQLLDLLAGAAPEIGAQQGDASAAIFSPKQMVSGLTRLHQLSTGMTAEQERDALAELHKPLTSPALLNYLFSKKSTRDGALQKCAFTHEQWLSIQPLFGVSAKAYLQEKGVFSSTETKPAAPDNGQYMLGPKSAEQSDISDDVLILDFVADAASDDMHTHASQDQHFERVNSSGAQLAENSKATTNDLNISDLVARIDDFTRKSSRPKVHDRAPSLLPFDELDALHHAGKQLEFQTDKDGVIIAASDNNFVGVKLFMAAEDTGWGCDPATIDRFAKKMAIRDGIIIIPGQRGGQKHIYANPEFDEHGRYCGYKAVIFADPKHQLIKQPTTLEADDERSDHYRQLIHELRTPVGALKGFAEILQSQLFGPVSKQYREMAEMILEDSELLLSHFDHLKHFEQKTDPGAGREPVKIADLVEQLKKAMLSVTAKAEIGVELELDAQSCVSPEIASALLFWAESHANGLTGNIPIAFLASKAGDKIYSIFTNGPRAVNAENSGKDDDKRNFAISLAHARLLDAGAKIESDSEKTIIDLPVMPVINCRQ